MIKYLSTAVALKCFSGGRLMQRLYRKIGNRAGGKRRGTGIMPGYYAERLKRMLRLQRKYGIVKDGDSIMELGTGWLHWEALTLRLFYNIKPVLFDVWDNRQFGGLKNYIRQLEHKLNTDFKLSETELKRAQSLIEAILKTESFDELYRLLGFEYVVESSGNLSQFPANSFQLIVSGGVLEHLTKEALPSLIAETQRILKPGGWTMHSIDTSDHLQHYDRSVSPKLYLSFSEGV